MNNELEALKVSKQLKDFVLGFVKNDLDRRFIHGSFNIIETELKDYEELQKDYCDVVEKRGEWQEKNKNKLKALEIIKKKEIDVREFKCYKSLTEYNQNVSPLKWLTQEEYDSVKKELLCQQ